MIGGTEYTVEVVSSYGLTTGGSLAITQISLDLDEALPTDATIAWYLGGESYRFSKKPPSMRTDTQLHDLS